MLNLFNFYKYGAPSSHKGLSVPLQSALRMAYNHFNYYLFCSLVYFSNLNGHRNHMETLLKYIFCFGRTRVGPKILSFNKLTDVSDADGLWTTFLVTTVQIDYLANSLLSRIFPLTPLYTIIIPFTVTIQVCISPSNSRFLPIGTMSFIFVFPKLIILLNRKQACSNHLLLTRWYYYSLFIVTQSNIYSEC